MIFDPFDSRSEATESIDSRDDGNSAMFPPIVWAKWARQGSNL
jgi:hypothetical protein